jgi:peptidoglycan/LPS O-acetylase OafA/YrhL
MMTFPAVFATAVGLGMIGQWTASYLTRQIPELQSEPYRIWFHIAGEMVTALLLILSGIGLITERSWAQPLYLVSVGMLIYTAIVSPGYFAQRGQWIWVLIFAVIVLLAIISAISVAGGAAG